MTITHYYPWAAQSRRFQEEIKNVFDRVLGDDTDQSNVVTSQWTPRVDIKEETNRFVILADIPGVDPNAIEVHMDKGILSLKGERKSEARTQTEKLALVRLVLSPLCAAGQRRRRRH